MKNECGNTLKTGVFSEVTYISTTAGQEYNNVEEYPIINPSLLAHAG